MRFIIKLILLLFLICFGQIAQAQTNSYVTISDCSCTCTCKVPIDTNTNSNTKNSTNTDSNNSNTTNTNNNSTNTNNNNTTNINNSNSTNSIQRIAYVNQMPYWWGPQIIEESFGLNSCYDVIILTFWLSSQGAFDAVGLYENIYANLGTNQYGSSNAEVQKNIRDLFHSKGKKLFVSAFGATDMPTSQNADGVANKLADWVEKNPYIDGIDLDYEDNAAVLNGEGVSWLIAFQKQLSARLGTRYLISHAPQAPYFSRQYYNDGGYYRIHKEVGNLIDWYNVQFYNQGIDNSYDTFDKLFVSSGSPFIGTSFSEIIKNAGIPLNKIVIGKPTTTQDAANTGYINPNDLGQLVKRAQTQLGLTIPGFFVWQLISDTNCQYAKNFQQGYDNYNLSNNSNIDINNNNNSTNSTNTNNNNDIANNSTKNNSYTSGQILSMAYINTITTWWGPQVIEAFGLNSCYDVIILTFWLSNSGPTDALLAYKNIYDYLDTNQYGKNSLEVQKTLQSMMKAKGQKLLISAFGDSDYPTKKDPSIVATDLANFANQLPYIDGIDIDYEDSNSIVDGTGVSWLITFTQVLRDKLINKNLILTHAPQAPYFSKQDYVSGAYYKIHQEVGHLIDWYNVQFYNQGDNIYDSYEKLFVQSDQWYHGTSYKEIIEIDGVPLNKIVLGKPSTRQEALNGYTDPKVLGQIAKRAQKELGYTIPGFFIWQLSSDQSCTFKNSFFEGFNTTL